MSSNSVQIVHQLHRDFQELVEHMTSKEAETQTAYEVELTLFRRLLKLGAQLLRLFFVHRAAVRPDFTTRHNGPRTQTLINIH